MRMGMIRPSWGKNSERVRGKALSFPFDCNRKIQFETVTRKKTRFGKIPCNFQYFEGLGQ
jgi:hypothetical protein